MNLLKLSLYYNIFLDIKRKFYKFFNPKCTKMVRKWLCFSPCVWWVCGGEGFREPPPTPQVMELGRLGGPRRGRVMKTWGEGG